MTQSTAITQSTSDRDHMMAALAAAEHLTAIAPIPPVGLGQHGMPGWPTYQVGVHLQFAGEAGVRAFAAAMGVEARVELSGVEASGALDGVPFVAWTRAAAASGVAA